MEDLIYFNFVDVVDCMVEFDRIMMFEVGLVGGIFIKNSGVGLRCRCLGVLFVLLVIV